MNILTIGSDNIVTLDKVMVPNSNPPVYVDNATITWQLLDPSNNNVIIGSGNYTYISGSNGEYQSIIGNAITSVLIADQEYTLKTSVTATGYVSLFQDTYLAQSPQSAQFSYCVRSDLENIYGSVNVQNWADINNDVNAQTIDARINWALVLSYDYVNSKLNGGVYNIPLTGRYPLIVNAQAQLACVYLYESRGLVNYTEDGRAVHQLSQGKDWANNVMSQIRAGILRIPNTLKQDIAGTYYPESIRATRCRPYYNWPYAYGCGY